MVRANQCVFIYIQLIIDSINNLNKEIYKAIMVRSRLRNKFLKGKMLIAENA